MLLVVNYFFMITIISIIKYWSKVVFTSAKHLGHPQCLQGYHKFMPQFV